jgi:addiction module HigA family antidote
MFRNGMRPIHPGEILLEDYIKPIGISVRALSIALHVPYSRLREIVDGNRAIVACRLTRPCDLSATLAARYKVGLLYKPHMTCEWLRSRAQKSSLVK